MKIDSTRKIWMKRSALYRTNATYACLAAATFWLYQEKYNVDLDNEEERLKDKMYIAPLLLKSFTSMWGVD